MYTKKGHEIYRQWIAIADMKNKKDSGVQGYVKVSVTVLGPGDKQVKHDLLKEIRATRRKQLPELEALAEDALLFLTEDNKSFVERVRSDGLMVCATCRWTSGCWRCDWRKSPRKS